MTLKIRMVLFGACTKKPERYPMYVSTNILTTIQMTVLQVCLFFYLNVSIYHDLIYYLCAFHNLCSPVVEHVCLRQVAVTI